jgi:hypothetical protein
MTPGASRCWPSRLPWPAPLFVALLLLGMHALAHGTSPEPLWIAGLYDGCDLDDLVQPLASAVAVAGDAGIVPTSPPPGPGAPRVPAVPGLRAASPAPAGPRAPPAA